MHPLGELKSRKPVSFGNAISILAELDQGEPLLFRGQADAAWTLCPSLFRGPNGAVLEIGSRRSRMDKLSKCLDEFIEAYDLHRGNGVNSAKRNYVEKMAIGQHYGLPTPLLDWTESALVALFMAIAFWDGRAKAVRVFCVSREDFIPANGAVLVEAKREGYRQSTQRGELSYCVEKARDFSKRTRLTAQYMDETTGGVLYFGGDLRGIDVSMNENSFDRARFFFSRNRLSFKELFPDSLYWAVHQIKYRYLY